MWNNLMKFVWPSILPWFGIACRLNVLLRTEESPVPLLKSSKLEIRL